MIPPQDDFDDYVRDHIPEAPFLPSNLRDQVWKSLRSQCQAQESAGWLDQGLWGGVPTLRFAFGVGITAILMSSLLGVWLGTTALTEPTANLFPALTSSPELLAP